MNIHRQIFRHIGLFLLLFCGIENLATAASDPWFNCQESWRWDYPGDYFGRAPLNQNYALNDSVSLPNNQPVVLLEYSASYFNPNLCQPLSQEAVALSNPALWAGVTLLSEPFKVEELQSAGKKMRYSYLGPTVKPASWSRPVVMPLLIETTLELLPANNASNSCKPKFVAKNIWVAGFDFSNCQGYKVFYSIKITQTGPIACPIDAPGVFPLGWKSFQSYEPKAVYPNIPVGNGGNSSNGFASLLGRDAAKQNVEFIRLSYSCPINPTPTPPPIPPSPEKKCQVVVKSAVRRR